MKSPQIVLPLLVLITILSACTLAPVDDPLITEATLETAPLPHSMKGYELYSWTENNQWHFTLMVGTNRLKSLEEITSGETVVSQDGWVKISVTGVGAIKQVLSRLPQGEEVFWIGETWREQAGAAAGSITLPAAEIIQDIMVHCKALGLVLQIAS